MVSSVPILAGSSRIGTELTIAEKVALGLEAGLDYEYAALNVENIDFSISQGTVIEVIEGAHKGGTVGALYQYLPQTDEADRIVLEQEDYGIDSRWALIVPDYDLDHAPPSGTVTLEQ